MAMDWKGPWKADVTYAQNDVVGYQGSSYIAIVPAPPVGQPPAPGSNWDTVAQGGQPGLTWKGAWTAQSYAVGDAVSYQDGAAYIATKPVTAEDVPGSSSNWNVLAQVGLSGISWKGEWLNTTQYHIHDAVAYSGSSYIADKEPPVGTVPTDPSYWTIMSKAADKAAMDIVNTVMSSVSAGATLAQFFLSLAGFLLLKGEVATLQGQVTGLLFDVSPVGPVGLQITAAQNTANTANTIANRAEGKADTADTTANRAEGKADTADTTANRAEGKADTAQQSADTANRTANDAKAAVPRLAQAIIDLNNKTDNNIFYILDRLLSMSSSTARTLIS
jgi:hypothetical protein